MLPLLKPTFGAAFTVEEGNKLEATFGDPDLSPEEKIASLEELIAQKERDLRSKKAQTGIPATEPSQPAAQQPPHQKSIAVDY